MKRAYLTVQYAENKKRLNSAFKQFRKEGWKAEQDFWCCSSCGWSALEDEEAEKAIFYHRQDTKTMQETGKLYLAWSGDGRRIVEILETFGLVVEWDGSENKRILVNLIN